MQTASTTFSWAVSPRLSLTTIDDQANAEGDTVNLQVTASSPDQGTLTYSATGLPTGLSINAQTGAITGTIASGAAAGQWGDGTWFVILSVTDGTFSASTLMVWAVENAASAAVDFSQKSVSDLVNWVNEGNLQTANLYTIMRFLNRVDALDRAGALSSRSDAQVLSAAILDLSDSLAQRFAGELAAERLFLANQPAIQLLIDRAVKELGSRTFSFRDKASKLLKDLLPYSEAALRTASQSNDAEVANRAENLLKPYDDLNNTDSKHSLMVIAQAIVARLESMTEDDVDSEDNGFLVTTLNGEDMTDLRHNTEQFKSTIQNSGS